MKPHYGGNDKLTSCCYVNGIAKARNVNTDRICQVAPVYTPIITHGCYVDSAHASPLSPSLNVISIGSAVFAHGSLLWLKSKAQSERQAQTDHTTYGHL